MKPKRSELPSSRCWARKRCAMPEETGQSLPDFASLQRGRFTYFPVVPGRLEFAVEVREALLARRPQVVALELPVTLGDAYLRAVERLPEISVIFYGVENDEEEAIYIPVEPADPFAEAIRTGLEIGAEILFADPELGERPHLPDSYPDPYALRSISRSAVCGVLPRISSTAIRGDRQTCRRDRLEIARHRPAGARSGGAVAESAGSGAGCHGSPQASAETRCRAATGSGAEPASGKSGGDHRGIPCSPIPV